jgi:hypothetical protein
LGIAHGVGAMQLHLIPGKGMKKHVIRSYLLFSWLIAMRILAMRCERGDSWY